MSDQSNPIAKLSQLNMNKNFFRLAIVLAAIAAIFFLVPPDQQQSAPERGAVDSSDLAPGGLVKNTGVKNNSPNARTKTATIQKPASELSRKEPRQLWKSIPRQEKPASVPESVEAEFIQMPVGALQNLQVGEKVDLLIPQKGQPYIGTVQKISSRFSDGNVKVS